MTERNKGLITTILWVLVAAYAVALVANVAFGLVTAKPRRSLGTWLP